MISVNFTKDAQWIYDILNNPRLKQMFGGNPNLIVKPHMEHLWLALKYNNYPAGVIEITEFSKITINVHICVLPEYQDGKIPLELTKEAIEYTKSLTTYKEVLTSIPETCRHARIFIKKVGFNKIGSISNGIIYRDKTQNLDLYQMSLR